MQGFCAKVNEERVKESNKSNFIMLILAAIASPSLIESEVTHKGFAYL
jgi:hypothetical protein